VLNRTRRTTNNGPSRPTNLTEQRTQADQR
jgi:hypothetical protein